MGRRERGRRAVVDAGAVAVPSTAPSVSTSASAQDAKQSAQAGGGGICEK